MRRRYTHGEDASSEAISGAIAVKKQVARGVESVIFVQHLRTPIMVTKISKVLRQIVSGIALLFMMQAASNYDASAQEVTTPTVAHTFNYQLSEDLVQQFRTSYTSYDLRLAGLVRRVVQYDTVVLKGVTGSSRSVKPDSTVWEFDRYGNVLNTLDHGVIQRYHHDAQQRIDSVATMRMEDTTVYSYLLKRYDAAGRLFELHSFLVDGRTRGEDFHAVIARNAHGDVDSVLYIGNEVAIFHTTLLDSDNGSRLTMLVADQGDIHQVIQYITNKDERLTSKNLMIMSEAEDTLYWGSRTILNNDGNATVKRQMQCAPAYMAKQLYTYGNNGEVTSYTSEERLDATGMSVSVDVRYSYQYDSHNNWVLRTITGSPVSNPAMSAVPIGDEFIPRIERHINYWTPKIIYNLWR